MTITHLKSNISNILNDIRRIVSHIFQEDTLFFENKIKYCLLFNGLSLILTNALTNIEGLYYKYILYPRLLSFNILDQKVN